MNPRAVFTFRSERKFRYAGYTLVFLMMACFVLTLSILIRDVLPGWHSGIFAGILMFIVLDRLYIHRQWKSLTPLSLEWAMAFGPQGVVIVLFSRLLLSYAAGPNALARDLSLLLRGYWLDLVTGEFVILLWVIVVAWELTAQFLDLLDEIGFDMKWASQEEPLIVQGNVVPAHQRLVTLIFATGIALVILTALTRINVSTIVTSPTGMAPVELSRFSGAEAGALLYFVFGLGLLSLSRLMSLQTHWNRLHIPVSSQNLPRQWVIYSLFFFFILAVFVSLMPAGDSFGLFAVIGTLLKFVFSIFVFLAQLIVSLIVLIFGLPFILFGKAAPRISRSVSPVMPALPTQSILPPTPNPTWELIKSILLWVSLLVIVVFALVQFVRQHESLLAAIRRSRLTDWLVLAWQWLYKNADRTRASLSNAIAVGWRNLVSRVEGKRVVPGLNLLRLRSLDSRRRVYFFYLAMVRRGGEQGLTREPSQTPAEYAAQLQKALPAAGEDIDSLTDAFIQARYTRQEVDAAKANSVKAVWERIRRALQGKKSQKPTSSP